MSFRSEYERMVGKSCDHDDEALALMEFWNEALPDLQVALKDAVSVLEENHVTPDRPGTDYRSLEPRKTTVTGWDVGGYQLTIDGQLATFELTSGWLSDRWVQIEVGWAPNIVPELLRFVPVYGSCAWRHGTIRFKGDPRFGLCGPKASSHPGEFVLIAGDGHARPLVGELLQGVIRLIEQAGR